MINPRVYIIAAAFAAGFSGAWWIQGNRWEAAESRAKDEVIKKIEIARQKEQAAIILSTETETRARDAIKGVYDYYKTNPRIVYRDRNGMLNNAECGRLSESPASTGNHQANATNDGHIAERDTREIQIIEPDIVPRAAETTIQALECRAYVEGLEMLFNQ